MPKVLIEKLDDYGRGITHINNKVVFVENALPHEEVEIQITSDHKKYDEAKVMKYVKKSKDRIESICPHFNECGGCNLLHLSYEDTLLFKREKIKSLLEKAKIEYKKEIEIIKNDNPFYYRNKISMKIENGKIGFYKDNTHELVEIKKCFLAKEPINEVIKNYKLLNLLNASLTVRCNNNNEILLIIESEEKNYNIELAKLKEKIKLVGIVYNNKTIYGDNFFYERINNQLFKVSYDSFFQINNYVASKLFNLIKNNISENSIVLDLYSGVGTLGISASSSSKEVYSMETISKLNIYFDTLIIDPPRKGLDKNSKNFILQKLPQKIIYVSCDPHTLIRDLKELGKEYEIVEFKILDMFSYTYHTECCVKLSRVRR